MSGFRVTHHGAQQPPPKAEKIESLGTWHTGIVKSFNHKTNFGFIECEELLHEYGADVYCRGKEIGHLDFGTAVTFELGLSNKGQPQAMNVEVTEGMGQGAPAKPKGKGKGTGKGKGAFQKGTEKEAEKPESLGEFHTGIVKSFNHKTNFGFIECEETFAAFGCDVFCRGFEIGHLDFGTAVSFELGLSSKGQPQAMNVEVTEGEGQGAPVKRKMPATKGKGGQKSNTAWQPRVMQYQGKGGPPVYMGTVKSFNHKTFYGFIQCDDLMDTYGCDIFCTGEEIGKLDFGQVVTFELKINNKGKPQAVNVVPEASGWIHGSTAGAAAGAAARAAARFAAAYPGSPAAKRSLPATTQKFIPAQQKGPFGKGKGKGAFQKGKEMEGEQPESLGEFHTGIVKSFNHKTNFGFIECEETQAIYGCDVFCRGKEIGHLDFGTTVTFELGLSSKGRPQAMNVEVAEGVEQPPPKRQKLRN